MTEIKSEKLTPMMKQYFEVKQQYPDTLVFFRLGDFYELFYDDAKIVSNLLDLTLTRRGNQGGEPVPMAGIPFHAADSYIARLLKMGRSIVICEQMVDKQTAGRSMIPRKVSRIITPGTVTDEGMVPERQDNILAAVFADKSNFGFSTLDLSTGRFTTTEVNNLPDLLLYVNKVNPAELLYPERFAYFKEIEHLLCIKSLPAWDFDFETAQTLLCQQFKTQSLSGFDVQGMHAGICAAGALLHYLKSTQTVDIAHITGIVHDKSSNLVLLDKNAQRNLELLSNLNLHLEDKLDIKVGSLSGGQRQALALLMATMTPVDFLILDEHTAALDPKTAEINMELTDQIVREKKLTSIMVTHNLRYAIEYGSRILMMHQGKVILDKSGEDKKKLQVEDVLSLFNEISIECGN